MEKTKARCGVPSLALLISSTILSRSSLSVAFHIHNLPSDVSASTMKAATSEESGSTPSNLVRRYDSPFGGKPMPSVLIMLNTPIKSNGANKGRLSGVLRALWDASSFRICADGGANRLYDATTTTGIEGGEETTQHYLPDLITGDLDSVRPDVHQYYQNMGVKIIRVDDQNYHDLDKSLMAAENWIKRTFYSDANGYSNDDAKANRVFIYGGFGGRFDQEMAIVNAICVWGKKDIFRYTTIAIYDEETCAFALSALPMRNEIRIRYPGDASEKDEEQMNQVGEGPTCGLIPMLGRCDNVTTSGLKWNLVGDVLEFGGLVSSSNRVIDEVVMVETSSPMIFTTEMIVKQD